MMMKKNWIRMILISMLAAGLACGCSNPQKAGVKALKAGEYKEAKSQFQEMVDSGDKEDAAEGYRGIGMACYEAENYKDALAAFKNAVDNGAEQTVQMYNLMGICAMQTKDYKSALEYIQAGLALADSSDDQENQPSKKLVKEMKYNEIICCEQQADWENAKKKVTEYLEQYPDDEAAQKEAEFLETR